MFPCLQALSGHHSKPFGSGLPYDWLVIFVVAFQCRSACGLAVDAAYTQTMQHICRAKRKGIVM